MRTTVHFATIFLAPALCFSAFGAFLAFRRKPDLVLRIAGYILLLLGAVSVVATIPFFRG